MLALPCRLAALICLALLLPGCASFSEGMTKAVLDYTRSTPQAQACELRGPAFDGLAALLRPEGEGRKKLLKLLMVHGIGDIRPGYSARLQDNLVRALELTRTSAHRKTIRLASPGFDEAGLGQVQVSRYLDHSGRRELLFYELTWSEVTRSEKALLDYDMSGHYRYRRAEANHAMKEFVNAHAADPILYRGTAKERILESASQASCWMLHRGWDDLPAEAGGFCDDSDAAVSFDGSPAAPSSQDFVFVTHSLGSRIVVDMLQRDADRRARKLRERRLGPERSAVKRTARILRQRTFRVYMLANQLPLLQLGRQPLSHAGQVEQYCRPQGAHYNERMIDELFILAFSDPNDLLSYALPPGFADQYVDSRLCPRVVNATVNVAPALRVFGMGALADPIAAHTEYDNDPRVIGLMVHGIGNPNVAEAVASGCTWLETVPDE